MAKHKFDKSKKIQDKTQRNIALCKRRRGFLKKAIELSRLCDQRIFLIIHDPEKDKAIQFTSDRQFNVQEAYSTARRIHRANRSNFDVFDNSDYHKFQLVDFRRLPYNSTRDPTEPAPGLDDSSMHFSE